MEKIDLEVDDFISYCDYKGLSTKTISSYEQTLRLFIRYLQDECNITRTEQVKEQTIKNYIANVKERGKYTVVADDNTKRYNHPHNRQDFGKKVSYRNLIRQIDNAAIALENVDANAVVNGDETWDNYNLSLKGEFDEISIKGFEKTGRRGRRPLHFYSRVLTSE